MHSIFYKCFSLTFFRHVNEEVITTAATAPSLYKTITDNVDTLKSRIKTSIHSLKECPSSKQESSSKLSQSVPENVNEGQTSVALSLNKTSTVEDIKVLGHLVIHNWREIFIFLSMGFLGAVNGLAKSVEYVGNFSLKFMHEFSFLMRTITPIILAVIELVGKLVGGLYLLIAMMFRGNGPPPQQFGRAQLQIPPQPDQIGRQLYPRGIRPAIGNNHYPPREPHNRHY